MKKLNAFLFLLMLLTSGALHAQSEEPIGNHELGLRFFGLNDFNFIYKKQTAPEKYRRYRLGYTNFNYVKNGPQHSTNIGLSIAIGHERRRQIAEKLKFLNGWELLGNFSGNFINNDEDSYEQLNITPGIGLVLGFQYDLSEKFRLSLESIPSLNASYTYVSGPNPDRFQVHGGFSSSAVALCLVYSFATQP